MNHKAILVSMQNRYEKEDKNSEFAVLLFKLLCTAHGYTAKELEGKFKTLTLDFAEVEQHDVTMSSHH